MGSVALESKVCCFHLASSFEWHIAVTLRGIHEMLLIPTCPGGSATLCEVFLGVWSRPPELCQASGLSMSMKHFECCLSATAESNTKHGEEGLLTSWPKHPERSM